LPSFNLSALSKGILQEGINKWVFNNSKATIYLVGGYIRDTILNRRAMDIDYVVEDDPSEIATEVSRRFNGKLIAFKGHVFRIVLKDKRIIDITPLRNDINKDLMLRDFTINAMAWSPLSGLIDPYGGMKDLNDRLIRVVREEGLLDDPLRILRAYRHANELSFLIEKKTSRLLKLYAPRLKDVPHERIKAEVFKILNHDDCFVYIRRSIRDNVLQEVFKLSKARLLNNLRLLRDYEVFIKRRGKRIKNLLKRRGFNDFLNEEFAEGLRRGGLIKLLFISDGMPADALIIPGKRIEKAITDMRRALSSYRKEMRDDELYGIFLLSRGYTYEVALIISIMYKKRLEDLLRAADKFNKKPLLNGDDLKELLGYDEGVAIGDALALLHKAQYSGKVKTKRQAQDFIRSNLT